MNEDYMIRIEGKQKTPDDENAVTLMTRGSYQLKNGNYFITYKETEATGYEGSTTTVKVDKSGVVTMIRFGKANSQLSIESGKRHVCHYETGFGALSLGISGNNIINTLNDEGGRLLFCYDVDINSNNISSNTVDITVKQAKNIDNTH